MHSHQSFLLLLPCCLAIVSFLHTPHDRIATAVCALFAFWRLSGNGRASSSSFELASLPTRSYVKALTWNIAAINNNPFEYWITADDPSYNQLMGKVGYFAAIVLSIALPLPFASVLCLSAQQSLSQLPSIIFLIFPIFAGSFPFYFSPGLEIYRVAW